MTPTPEPPPGHPFTPGQVRMLRMAVIIMGVLIILGLIALVFGIARQAKKMAGPRETSIAEQPFSAPVPVGAGQVRSMVLNEGILAVHIGPEGAQGAGSAGQIILFDIRRNREIGRIRLQSSD